MKRFATWSSLCVNIQYCYHRSSSNLEHSIDISLRVVYCAPVEGGANAAVKSATFLRRSAMFVKYSLITKIVKGRRGERILEEFKSFARFEVVGVPSCQSTDCSTDWFF